MPRKQIRYFRQNHIHKAKRGQIYDDENKKYNCYMPALNGAYSILDCWVCDEAGNIHPGYNVSPVPVHHSALGKIVNVLIKEN